MSQTDSKAAQDMTEAMEKTLQQLEGRFQAVSAQLENKHDMGTRIDGLQKNVAELMTQAGMEEQAHSK